MRIPSPVTHPPAVAPRRPRAPRRARGVYLVELIATLMVVGAVLLITAQIAATTSRASRDANRFENTLNRLDLLIAALRRDAWPAAAFRVTPLNDAAGPGTRLEIQEADGRITLWQSHPDGIVTRTGPGGLTRSWGELPPLRFSADGPLVTLQVLPPAAPARAPGSDEVFTPTPAPLPPEQITFPSQRLLAGAPQ